MNWNKAAKRMLMILTAALLVGCDGSSSESNTRMCHAAGSLSYGVGLVKETMSDGAMDLDFNHHRARLVRVLANEARDQILSIDDERVRSGVAWQSIRDSTTNLADASDLVLKDDLGQAGAMADAAETALLRGVNELDGCALDPYPGAVNRGDQ